MAERRPALGRGLSALIPEKPAETTPPPPAVASIARPDVPTEVDLDLLRPNRFQPRQIFDDQPLADLADSIRANGVIQPIVVRRAGSGYEIIAGERRWRAAQVAGLLKVPIVVRDVPDDKLLQVALIENVQRENLNPIDEALAYRRLMDEFKLTQEQVAVSVNKDRSSVANYLRLLKLPASVQALVAAGALSMGHARAILAVEESTKQAEVAARVRSRGLSVRDTEKLVKHLSETPTPPPSREPPDVHTRQAEERLRLALGTRVRIMRKGKGGHVEIDFVSEDELQRLYEYMIER